MLRLWQRKDVRERALLAGVVFLLVIPVVTFALANAPYSPLDDRAVFELGVRRVAEGHPPTVGAFSRFGWYHPGPVLYYVLAVPYLLAGEASIAMPIGALAINATCLLAIALLVRRHRGLVSALWALLVCLLYVRQLEAGFLLDVWNPYLPVLPFLVAVFLCWAALCGDRWAFPAAVVVLSACVQAHVGYAVAAGGLIAVTGCLSVLRRLRGQLALPTARASLIGAAAVLLMWLPPIWQQFSGRDPNLSAVISDLTQHSSAGPSMDTAFRLVASELGRLPSIMLGIGPDPRFLEPRLPLWTGIIALILLIAVGVVAAHRHDVPPLVLGALTLVVAAAAAFAVTRVHGLLFGYLVQWATVAGILLWTTVGFVITNAVATGARWKKDSDEWRGRLVTVGVCIPLLWVTGLVIAHHARPPDADPNPRRLAEAVAEWLPNKADTLAVQYAATVRPSFLGVTIEGSAFILELDRRDIKVQPPEPFEFVFKPVQPKVSSPPKWTVLIGLTGNVAPPPPPFTQIARTPTLVAYAHAGKA